MGGMRVWGCKGNSAFLLKIPIELLLLILFLIILLSRYLVNNLNDIFICICVFIWMDA